METSPHQPIDLSTHVYYQLVHTLTSLLPPPIDDSPQALRTRNHAAIAKVAALLPVNANEADLAAQCIAARAQAEEMLRLIRQQAGHIGVVMKLNAQYGSMVRTSLSVHGRLMRVQALRQKRQAIGATANEDAWALHVAEQSMLEVVDPPTRRRQMVSPEAARAVSPEAAPAVSPTAAPVATQAEAPAACMDRNAADRVSENGTNSHDAAFETRMGAQPRNRGSSGSAETALRAVVCEAMAEPLSANPPTAPQEAAQPTAAPAPTQVEAPAACVDQTVADNVSEDATNSHDTAFETWLSAQTWNQGSAAETDLRHLVREAMANPPSAHSANSHAGRGESRAKSRAKSPGRAG